MARSVQHIVVHCSATPATMDIGRREIARWHRERGFRDIGYHFVIRRNGRLERGRHLNSDHVIDTHEIGAHVAGHNATSVGICLVGGVDAAGKPEANYTPAQMRRLWQVVSRLSRQFPGAEVVGHTDLDPRKACPCFNVGRWWLGLEPEEAAGEAAVDELLDIDPPPADEEPGFGVAVDDTKEDA